jgi:hypothetical protein
MDKNPNPGSSNTRAEVTEAELREIIDEEAWLRARRDGRPRCTFQDRADAEASVLSRLGLNP